MATFENFEAKLGEARKKKQKLGWARPTKKGCAQYYRKKIFVGQRYCPRGKKKATLKGKVF